MKYNYHEHIIHPGETEDTIVEMMEADGWKVYITSRFLGDESLKSITFRRPIDYEPESD